MSSDFSLWHVLVTLAFGTALACAWLSRTAMRIARQSIDPMFIGISRAKLVVGSPAPDIEATALDTERPFKLVQLRGQPVALIYMSMTCSACHAMLPALKKLVRAYQGPMRFAAIVVGIEPGLTDWVKMEKLPFPALPAQHLYRLFEKTPGFAVVDEKGIVTHMSDGRRPVLEDIEKVLGLHVNEAGEVEPWTPSTRPVLPPEAPAAMPVG